VTCNNPPGTFISEGASNITVEGCTFTGDYTPSLAPQLSACGYWGVVGGAVPAAFYGGSNITFTDNAVMNTMGGVGLLFDVDSNVTVSNNYFANNYSMGMQVSNCKNCNFTGNTSLDSGWDQQDAIARPAGYDTGTWSNNIFACDSTGQGYLMYNSAERGVFGGNCVFSVGDGCSTTGCPPGEYSGVTVQNNTITGPSSVLWISTSYGGATQSNNSFTNGGSLNLQ
jgi:parallel beta-helix repeat protein